jgi:predicted TIM-barrel fold metal-dependent hydrolase
MAAPTIPIIAAHHHIWRAARSPWLSGPVMSRILGDYTPIRRDYLIGEYAADARSAGVAASVHAEANADDDIGEARWAAETGRTAGLVQAVVAHADLAALDVAATLDTLAQIPGVRGIRQQLHWHPNPAWRYAPTPDLMLQPAWQQGLRRVHAHNLLFELQVFPNQYPHAARLLDTFPQMTFVLLHAGLPDDHNRDALAAWRRGLVHLAAGWCTWPPAPTCT